MSTPTHIRDFPVSDLNLVAMVVVNVELDQGWGDHNDHGSGLEKRVEHQVRDEAAWTRYEQIGADSTFMCKCDCCGNRLIYACVVEHTPTGVFYHIGRDCFGNVECLQQNAHWVSMTGDMLVTRVAAGKKAAKERKAGDVRELKFFTEFSDLRRVFDFAKNPPIQQGHPSYGKISWAVATLGDMHGTIRRFGKLSHKQFDLARKLHTESLDKIEQDRDRAEQLAAAVEAGFRAPVGRVAVEGVVVSTKWVDSDFGGSTKCLVDFGNGTRAWGTLPSSVETGKGDRVRFRASFELSDKDPLFSFYKRPTNWERLDLQAA